MTCINALIIPLTFFIIASLIMFYGIYRNLFRKRWSFNIFVAVTVAITIFLMLLSMPLSFLFKISMTIFSGIFLFLGFSASNEACDDLERDLDLKLEILKKKLQK